MAETKRYIFSGQDLDSILKAFEEQGLAYNGVTPNYNKLRRQASTTENYGYYGKLRLADDLPLPRVLPSVSSSPQSPMKILNEITSFRLGYTEERPYPWRWTTPIVLCAFLFISPFLAVVNVPLSAYNIVQEFTYRPNDSLPAVFLGNLVPSVLQSSTDSFSPQILNIGEPIILDEHIFNYTVAQAFDGVDTSKPVSAFPYYNNPLSDSCDATNITVQLLLTDNIVDGHHSWESDYQISGTVACSVPSLFYLTWVGFPWNIEKPFPLLLLDAGADIAANFGMWWSGPKPKTVARRQEAPQNVTQISLSLTVHPCCDCDAVLAGARLENRTQLVHAPCSSRPPHFLVVNNPAIAFSTPDSGSQLFPAAIGPIALPAQITDVLEQAQLGNLSISRLGTSYDNLIQMVYHLVRLDLGVTLENQIYNSPEMFNRTIIDMGNATSSNVVRDWTSNATLMGQWQQAVGFYPNNTRVPPLEYLRSVPRLKPVGSAVTSVFVSTFAMLSVMWSLVSLVAGALARTHSAPRGRNEHMFGHSETRDKWLENRIDEGSEVILLGDQKELESVERLRHRMDRNEAHMRNDLQAMQAALARLTVALTKYDLVEKEICGDGLTLY
ncbi:hypothetical protein C8R45DRAFT_1148969 [Mycena sanguinolenta]|nr:hypothetical protein C8R45DRAFT_1148969 [Mycena sanguinolenta]